MSHGPAYAVVVLPHRPHRAHSHLVDRMQVHLPSSSSRISDNTTAHVDAAILRTAQSVASRSLALTRTLSQPHCPTLPTPPTRSSCGTRRAARESGERLLARLGVGDVSVSVPPESRSAHRCRSPPRVLAVPARVTGPSAPNFNWCDNASPRSRRRNTQNPCRYGLRVVLRLPADRLRHVGAEQRLENRPKPALPPQPPTLRSQAQIQWHCCCRSRHTPCLPAVSVMSARRTHCASPSLTDAWAELGRGRL
ncbi:hypothetical protein B0H15DRAFT_949181 [Mycena belliarum]|uniref:Uncharacterized protein n=1 Tax=Mycena belliarum TaxID=1033014 RepID=A0AAD6U566_9AGAR|nr:hypothetical protein B0H15DRAFT_949181 [Mycena belliae]